MWTQNCIKKINNIELSSICKEKKKPDFVLQMLDGFVVVGLALQSQNWLFNDAVALTCIKTASRKLVCIFLTLLSRFNYE